MNRTNWKLIKTAPKDGTEIIGVHISEWGDRQKTLYGPWTVAFRSGRWQSSWDGVQVIDYMSDFGTDYKTPDLEPTHWIPLPEVVNTDPEVSSRTETAGWKHIGDIPSKPMMVEFFCRDLMFRDYKTGETTSPIIAPWRDCRFDLGYFDGSDFRDLGTGHLTFENYGIHPATDFPTHYRELVPPAVAETDADAQRDDGLLSGVSADPTPT